MKFFNLGLAEILLIVILALIILGPGNMVKAAREVGAFIRRVTKSPYWQEVWATRRELNEIPRILAREANLDETLKDLNRETKMIHSSVTSSVSDFMKEVDEPLKELDKDLKKTSAFSIDDSDPSPETTNTES